MTVDQQARTTIRSLTTTLDDLPLAHDQLWMHLLPGNRRGDRGSRQRHAVLDRGSVVNLEVVDLLDTREKPGAELLRSDEAIEADQLGRRLGVLPTIGQWVRLVDDRMCEADEWHESPFALVACSLSCKFMDRADEVATRPPFPGYHCSGIARTHWRRPTVSSHSRWLRQQVRWTSQHDWAAIMDRDLQVLLNDIIAVTGSDRPSTIECLSCGNTAYPQKGGAWYHCPSCNQAWSRPELIHRAERNAPKTLIECCKLLNIPERTMRRYLAQDPPPFLPIKGLKRGKAPLFDPKEVDNATRSLRYRNADQQLVS